MILTWALVLSPREAASQNQKLVLALHAARQENVISVLVDTQLQRTLRDGLNAHFDYYPEYIDFSRFQDASFQEAVRAFLRSKYAGYKFDLIVADSDASVDFLKRYRDALFPGTPVVTTATQALDLPNAAAVSSLPNLKPTVDSALGIQPDTRRVVVVSGGTDWDYYYDRLARSQLKELEGRIEVVYLSGLPMRELLRQAATQPAHSILLLNPVYGDGNREKFLPMDVADRIAKVANVPVYAWLNSAMGHGTVGGRMQSPDLLAQHLAGLALRVLRGERPDTIPLVVSDWSVTEFDWRQLQRWGISESRLPAGSTILYRQPGAWELYRAYILAGTFILTMQTALIVGLMVQRGRYRRTALALRQSYEQQQDLAGRLIDAQERERARLARDLHDDVSQRVAGVSVMLSVLQRQVGKHGSEADIASTVTTLQERSESLAESIRNLSHELHPEMLKHTGLVVTLRRHCAEVAENHQLSVTVTAGDDLNLIRPEAALCLFRVAQEALANVVRHARAKNIAVDLTATDECVALSIADDGVGFATSEATRRGLGLRSIDERVRFLQGTLAVESTLGLGTRVIVRLPVAEISRSRSAELLRAVPDPSEITRSRSADRYDGAVDPRGQPSAIPAK